jgi:hypothetical protein
MTQPSQRERAPAITSTTFADELMQARQRAVLLTREYNASCGQPAADREAILRRQARSGAYFEPDLHCQFGYNVTLADGFSANFDCVLLGRDTCPGEDRASARRRHFRLVRGGETGLPRRAAGR